MKTITTLSQLGARLAIARWHVSRLQKSAPDKAVNHILYVVDPRNTRLREYADSLGGAFTVYDRGDNNWTDFNLRTGSAFGGDANYDFLIRRPEVGEVFLTLHDDSILCSPDTWRRVRELTDEYHFGGYLDTRGVPQYERLYFDGIKMAELRIGTWFCFGRTQHYRDCGYTIGDYRNYFKWMLNWKFKSWRVSADGWRVWLNGGFDLNIRARLRGDRFCILDQRGEPPLAEHWNKITGFFVKRDLLQYADGPDEVDRWVHHLAGLKARDPEQFKFDVGFLERLARELHGLGIHDPLLNLACMRRFHAL